MDGMKPDVRGHHDVAGDIREQEMPVVRLESVVRPLPEIRAAVRLDTQTPPRGIDAPARRLAEPAQPRIERGCGERFVQMTPAPRSFSMSAGA
jgi:hypothetical protein